MNRSVINWMITVGVLSAGAVVTAAPAAADAVGPGPVSGSDTVKPSGSDTVKPRGSGTAGSDAVKPSGNDTAKRDYDRGAGPRPVRHNERLEAEKPHSGRDDDWPCCSRICRRGSDRRERGDSGLGLLLAGLITPQRPPVAAVQPAFEPVGEVLPAVIAPARPASPAPVLEARPAPGVTAPVPAASQRTMRPAAPVPPLPGPIPLAPVPPPEAPADSTGLLRLGYPDEFRGADLGHVAALALPGLAAIVGMTALGGMLGYRQAKAGYVLRAAGAGRFLQ